MLISTPNIICIGFVLGGLVGAKFAVNMPREILQRIFGSALVIIGIYMTFKK